MPHPEKRDLDLTERQLCAWLATQLVGARDVRVIMRGGPSSSGFSSDTVMFDAAWADAAGAHREPLVARFTPRGKTVFPTYDVGLQYRVMKILGDRTNVPVPRMRWNEPRPQPLGVPFYVMDRLDGRVPADNPPFHMTGWVADLSANERERLWWNGLEAMTRVHRLDWRALGFDFLEEPRLGATVLEQQLHYYDYVSWGFDSTRYPAFEAAQRWLRANQPADQPVALCWGDARVGNQIFNAQLDVVAVVDWEMVRLGDPVQDLTWFMAIDRFNWEGYGLERLAGFPDRAATIARWEELVGRAARHIPYYDILGVYKFALVVARVDVQMKYYEIMPADGNMDVDNWAYKTLAGMLQEAGG
ncbi:MAG: phosphotransferase family protein [Candidatus Binatia bacterium]